MSDERKLALSRRQLLGGLATVGAASAGAGLGTTALFSDTESFEGNSLAAGQLDLAVKADVYEYQGQANGGGQSFSGIQNGQNPTVHQQLDDVKPGDYSYGKFCFSLVDNPGYIWAGGQLTGNAENGLTEPEGEVDTTGGSPGDGNGELADAIEVTLYYRPPGYDVSQGTRPSQNGNIPGPGNDNFVTRGTLREVLAELQTGIPLDSKPGSGNAGRQAYTGTPSRSFDDDKCLAFAWELPKSVGNEVQTDSVEFDISFVAYQERNNDGSQQPFADETFSTDYSNDWKGSPPGSTTIDDPTDGTVVTNVNFGDQTVAVSFTFQDDSDGLDFLDPSDYSSTNLPMAIDANNDGVTDFQVAWQPNASFPDDPFAYINHPDSSSTDSPSSLPAGFSAGKTGNTITFGLPKSVVGSSFRLFVWASTGGEGPVVEIDDDSNTQAEFFDSTDYVQLDE